MKNLNGKSIASVAALATLLTTLTFATSPPIAQPATEEAPELVGGTRGHVTIHPLISQLDSHDGEFTVPFVIKNAYSNSPRGNLFLSVVQEVNTDPNVGTTIMPPNGPDGIFIPGGSFQIDGFIAGKLDDEMRDGKLLIQAYFVPVSGAPSTTQAWVIVKGWNAILALQQVNPGFAVTRNPGDGIFKYLHRGAACLLSVLNDRTSLTNDDFACTFTFQDAVDCTAPAGWPDPQGGPPLGQWTETGGDSVLTTPLSLAGDFNPNATAHSVVVRGQVVIQGVPKPIFRRMLVYFTW